MSDPSNGYRAYTTDGTYWTGRRSGSNVKVVRKGAEYETVETFGTYSRVGSAVGAAAQLAYAQGWNDAQRELSNKVHEALTAVGLSAPVVVDAPDVLGGDDVEDAEDD